MQNAKFIGLLLLSVLLIPSSASAYVLLHSPATGSSTANVFGNTSQISSYWEIDCSRLGWGEVSSVAISALTVSGTRSGFKLMDMMTGQVSSNSYSVTTSETNMIFNFSPALWCSGSRLVFAQMNDAGATQNVQIEGGSAGTGADDLLFAWASINGNGTFTGMQPQAHDWNAYIWGSVATGTTAGDSGTSTTITVTDPVLGGLFFVSLMFLLFYVASWWVDLFRMITLQRP